MGQYYMVYMKKGENETVYNTTANGEYCGCKLMEHSWWNNQFVGLICRQIYNDPAVIAWCGDYADDCSDEDIPCGAETIRQVYRKTWTENKDVKIFGDFLCLNKRYLVNHSKKSYIDCSEYYENAEKHDSWIVHPLPILTAAGNGFGGGDYHGENSDLAGSWCMDTVEVRDSIPDGYKKENILFFEYN